MSNPSEYLIPTDENLTSTEAEESFALPAEDVLSLLEEELPQIPTSQEEETPAPEPPSDELSSLRRELARLQQELASKEAALQKQKALAREQEEFSKLFPGTPLSDIPKEVRSEAADAGIPLAAAFALYEKKREAEQRHIRTVNLQNARSAPGLAGVGTASEFLTPEEVRRMSPTEVRANYKTIFESMKKW